MCVKLIIYPECERKFSIRLSTGKEGESVAHFLALESSRSP